MERVEIRVEGERKARWQALARARVLSLTAFLVEAVERPLSSVPESEPLRGAEDELREELRELDRRLSRIERLGSPSC